MKKGYFEVIIPEGRETSDGYVALQHATQYTVILTNYSTVRCDAEVMLDGRKVGVWRVGAGKGLIVERPIHDSGRFTFYVQGTKEAKAAGLFTSDDLGRVSVRFMPEHIAIPEYLQGMAAPLDQKFSAGKCDWSIKSEHEQLDESGSDVEDEDSDVTDQPEKSEEQNALGSKNLNFGPSSDKTNSSVPLDGDGKESLPAMFMAAPYSAPSQKLAGGTGLSGHSEQSFSDAEDIVRDHDGEVSIHLRLVALVPAPRPLFGKETGIPQPVANKAASQGRWRPLTVLESVALIMVAGFLVFLMLVLSDAGGFGGKETTISSPSASITPEATAPISSPAYTPQVPHATPAPPVAFQPLAEVVKLAPLHPSQLTETGSLPSKSTNETLRPYDQSWNDAFDASEARAIRKYPALTDESSELYASVSARCVELVALKDSGLILPFAMIDGSLVTLDPFNPDFPYFVACEQSAKLAIRSTSIAAATKNGEFENLPLPTPPPIEKATIVPVPPKAVYDATGWHPGSKENGTSEPVLRHLPSDERLTSGSILTDQLKTFGGKGKLTLDNGLTEDAYVKMIHNEKLVASFYVRGGESFTFAHVPDGVYKLIYCTGFGWNAGRRDFARGRHAVRYDTSLDYLTTKRKEGNTIITSTGVITLTLHKVAHGNTSTSDISLDEFDRY